MKQPDRQIPTEDTKCLSEKFYQNSCLEQRIIINTLLSWSSIEPGRAETSGPQGKFSCTWSSRSKQFIPFILSTSTLIVCKTWTVNAWVLVRKWWLVSVCGWCVWVWVVSECVWQVSACGKWVRVAGECMCNMGIDVQSWESRDNNEKNYTVVKKSRFLKYEWLLYRPLNFLFIGNVTRKKAAA